VGNDDLSFISRSHGLRGNAEVDAPASSGYCVISWRRSVKV